MKTNYRILVFTAAAALLAGRSAPLLRRAGTRIGISAAIGADGYTDIGSHDGGGDAKRTYERDN